MTTPPDRAKRFVGIGPMRMLIRRSCGSGWMATGVLLAAAVVGSLLSGRGQAAVFTLPPDGGSLIGQDQQVQSKASDTLLGIARKYSVGYWEIQEANPKVDLWLPGREQPIVITYPVSPGEKGWATPVGVTRIIRKVPHPVWIPTPSILKAHEEEGDPIPRIYPAGPDNPMGEWALQTTLSHGEIYIHGTNNPMAIGMAVTHGCVRLYPEDIAALFPVVPVGTRVNIVSDPILATLQDGKLYLEIHPPAGSGHKPAAPDYQQISKILDAAIGKNQVAIAWGKVRQVATQANGIPQLVGVQAFYNPPGGSPDAQQPQPTERTMLSAPRRSRSGAVGAT
jgi:L,D-transpeptidase ErfK/SrfK